MTSGNFTSFPVDQIWVDRKARQRQEIDPKRVTELAESIARNGLIHPPVIKRDGQLIAGERRYLAVKSLGWTNVPVQFAEDLSEIELHMIELEENIRRVDITWQEECQAVERYHRLKSQTEEDWTTKKTAEMLGMSPEAVNQKRAVAKEIEAGNKRVIEAPKFSTARGIVSRTAERRKAAVLESITIDDEPAPERTVPLLNADFIEWARDYSGPKFNFLHCDFPYGVNADKHNQGSAKSFGGYEDSADVYFQLLDTLEGAMENVVAPSAHLMFWFSMDYYEITRQRLEKMGWKVNPFPLIWFKSDNTGILPDPKRGPRRVYETAFFASRGDRKIISAVSNVCAAPGREKTVHMSEKPRSMLRHFFRMVVDEYSYVLDPTCGSGNAVRVAQDLGASQCLGLEKSEEFYSLAKEHFYADDLLPL